jgi:hypothetical protein
MLRPDADGHTERQGMYVKELARNRFHRNAGEGGGGGTGTEGGQPAKFSPITSQADLDKIIQDRVRREQQKYRDYDTLKSKAEQYDVLARESLTDREREIEEARLEAYHEAMAQAVPLAVRAEFRSAAKGVLTPEQLESLLEDLDLTRYATDEGQPNEDKITKKIATFAPAKGQGGGTTGFGQGQRQHSSIRRGEAGLLEAQRRFGQKAESKS